MPAILNDLGPPIPPSFLIAPMMTKHSYYICWPPEALVPTLPTRPSAILSASNTQPPGYSTRISSSELPNTDHDRPVVAYSLSDFRDTANQGPRK